MKVRLLQDVIENGQVKTTIRRNRGAVVGWFRGAEVELSDASAAKFIKDGKAEAVAPKAVTTKESLK